MTAEGEALKTATLSQQSVWVWPNAEHDDLLFPFTLSTVALPPRAASTPVRFNRVYSKVTHGTLSVIHSPFYSPEYMNCAIRLMEYPYRHYTHIFSLCVAPFPSALLVFPSKGCQPLITSQSIHFPSSMPPTRHTAPLFALSSPVEADRGGGMGTRAHTHELNKSRMLKPAVRRDVNQFIWVSKKKERRRMKANNEVHLFMRCIDAYCKHANNYRTH